jgi:hypothetical protein
VDLAKKPPAALAALHANPWTEPFWRAAAEHRLVAPRCADCGTFRMPPSAFCHACQSQRIDWLPLAGRGTVYSYTIVRRALIPLLEGSIPHVIAVIELAGAPGARLVSNVIDVAPERVAVGMAVEVAWDDVREGVAIPRFRAVG